MAGLEAATENYITQGMHSVEGWIAEADARLIAQIDLWQREKSISGDLCEIGVFHGRSLVLLGHLTRLGEVTFGFDFFSTNPGDGDEATARANVARFFDDTKVRLFNKDSRQLTPIDLQKPGASEPSRIRLFCVDGGHTREMCGSDFRFAEQVLAPGGVMVVDDFFNREWPGVSEAIYSIFDAGESKLKPFAIGVDKVFFADPVYAESYRAAMSAEVGDGIGSTREMLGAPVLIMKAPASALTQAWQRFRDTPIARVARRFAGIGQIAVAEGLFIANELMRGQTPENLL